MNNILNYFVKMIFVLFCCLVVDFNMVVDVWE